MSNGRSFYFIIFKFHFQFTFYNTIHILYMRLFITKDIYATIESRAWRDCKGHQHFDSLRQICDNFSHKMSPMHTFLAKNEMHIYFAVLVTQLYHSLLIFLKGERNSFCSDMIFCPFKQTLSKYLRVLRTCLSWRISTPKSMQKYTI